MANIIRKRLRPGLRLSSAAFCCLQTAPAFGDDAQSSAGFQFKWVRFEKVAQAFQPAVSQVFNLLAVRSKTGERVELNQWAGDFAES